MTRLDLQADAAADQRARRRGFALVTAVLALFLAAASAPSPLYAVYAAAWRFSAVQLTAVFAVYALALLAALLVAGSLSDAVGRRPVLLAALAVQCLAMLLFLGAGSLAWLYAARVVQGLATGLATAAVAAALIDLQPARPPAAGALVNAVTPTFGLALGALSAGALVQYAPAPTRLVYALFLAAFAVLAAALALVPETVEGRRRPQVRIRLGVEPAVRPAFIAALPCLVATWALGGLYLSLGPSIALSLARSTNRLEGGAAVALLCVAGGVASLAVHAWPARRAMLAGCAALAAGALVTVGGVATGAVPLYVVGTLVAGAGFGTAFLGAFRTLAALAAPAHRGELVAAVYVVAYLAFSLPAVVAGALVPHAGLRAVAIGYGLVLAALALVALVTTALVDPRRKP